MSWKITMTMITTITTTTTKKHNDAMKQISLHKCAVIFSICNWYLYQNGVVWSNNQSHLSLYLPVCITSQHTTLWNSEQCSPYDLNQQCREHFLSPDCLSQWTTLLLATVDDITACRSGRHYCLPQCMAMLLTAQCSLQWKQNSLNGVSYEKQLIWAIIYIIYYN